MCLGAAQESTDRPTSVQISNPVVLIRCFVRLVLPRFLVTDVNYSFAAVMMITN